MNRNILFTSDLHLGHEKIISLVDRPFKDVYEMNERLIRNWNERVKPEDDIYNLGDVIFYRSKNGNGANIPPKDILPKLNGHITYVVGNHDAGGRNGLNIKNHRIVLYLSNMFVNLVHDPAHGSVEYELNLHGHLHGKDRIVKIIEKDNKKSLYIDVGTDCWNFRPVTWQKLYEIYSQFKAGKDIETIYNK